MLSMGAELGQTQSGNNNAYAQDNGTAWLDWNAADRELLAFTAELIALRKDAPALTRDDFLRGSPLDETLIPDVEWLRADGGPIREEDWRDGQATTLIACLYVPAENTRDADRLAIVWRRGLDALHVATPPARSGFAWTIRLASAPARTTQNGVVVAARSVVLREEAAAFGRQLETEAPRELVSALAQAAGVAPGWRDADSAEHQNPPSTIDALLTALDLPAKSLSQARDSLALLARREDARALPMSAGSRRRRHIPASSGLQRTRGAAIGAEARRRRAKTHRPSRKRCRAHLLARRGRPRLRGPPRAPAAPAAGAPYCPPGGDGLPPDRRAAPLLCARGGRPRVRPRRAALFAAPGWR